MAVLVGCQESASVDAPLPSFSEVAYRPYSGTESAYIIAQLGTGTEADKAAAEALIEEASAAFNEGEGIMKEAASWKKAHEEIQELLETYADHPMAQGIEQRISMEMLPRLLQLPASSERDEALRYYTGLLVENGNPDASLIYPALKALQPSMPEAAWREWAEATIQTSTAWARRYPCADCLGKTGTEAALRDAQQYRSVQISEAVRLLSQNLPR